VPATASIGGLPDLLELARRVEPPYILKPTDRSGSEWVLCVDRREDLLSAHLRIRDGLRPADRRRHTAEPRYVAQELVQGREISADLYLRDGRLVDVLRWTEKHFVHEDGLAGLVGAYYPARLDEAERRSLAVAWDAAAAALGVDSGVVMVDGILRNGVLHLLEMGLRPGGDCLPDLYQAATGYDPVRAACQAALGQRPDGPQHAAESIAAIHLMTRCDGRIVRLDLDAVRAHPGVLHVDPYRGPGDVVRRWAGSYDDRIVASCLVRFDAVEELAGLVTGLSDRVVVEVTPLDKRRRPTLEAA